MPRPIRAFRRPLGDKEVERYSKLFAGQKNFVAGAQLVVEAMLQSSSFLFRAERGGEARSYGMASRLSYFLWDTMPDAAADRSLARTASMALPSRLSRSRATPTATATNTSSIRMQNGTRG